MESDDALMDAYGRGEAAAFDALVARHERGVYGFLCRTLSDDALAEDALVETFFKLHRSAASYEPRGLFKTYLYTIAYREAMSLLRSRLRGVHGKTILVGDGPGLSQAPSRGPSPERELENRAAIAAVEELLGELPERQRAVFILYYREGMATAEIADLMDIPSGSVRAYLSMVRKEIRQRLPELRPGARPSV